MSVLALYTRSTAGVDAEAAGGPPVGSPNQGMFANNGAVEAINNSERDHASQGLPMSILGRVIFAPTAPVDYYNQGVPYSATGNVVTGAGPVAYYDQGVGFNANGEIVTV